MVKKKGKSKRTTLKDKYKIQKRTVQTHRKNRKQAKKDVANGVVQHKKKDPGIPNTWPFKADLLKEIQRTRERQQALQQTKKEQRADQLRALRQHQAEGGTARTVEKLAQMADQMRHEYRAATSAAALSGGVATNNKDDSAALGQQSRRAYLRELKKVVEASDVLLQVLDARDPVGTRLGAMAEDAILSHSDKRMVLVLNKIDLVPKEVVGAWLTHLRKSHPTIALQANKVAPSKGKGSSNNASGDNDDSDDDNATMATSGTTSNSASSSSLTSGMDGLLQLLKNYARTSGGGKNSKTNIVVGVVGYPNTGKSSILRSLTQCRGHKQTIGVSPRPGFTTSLQEVVLDKQVRLLDSPGVVFDDSSALLCNCVDAESMDDPVAAVEAMLQRCTHQSLVLTYNLPHFVPGNVDMFLALMAKKHGRVTKGGIPDKVSAARGVLKDWNSGKIPFYTTPPAQNDEESDEQRRVSAASAVIVSELGEDFLRKLDEQVLSGLPDDNQDADAMDYLELKPTDSARGISGLNFDEEEECDDDDEDDDGEEDDSDMDVAEESQDYDFDEMA